MHKIISETILFSKRSRIYVDPKGVLEWFKFIAYFPIAYIHYWILTKKDCQPLD